MTIIVFLIDTSASMNQRAYIGGRPTMLDVAKGAVETFVKVRQRSQDSRGDRYMLMTFEDPPANIKAGWKENLTTFMNELKNLQSNCLTTLGAALKNCFDILNINRMQTGIDTYGQGRSPFYLEPSMIVVITDGGKLSNAIGVQEELNLPMYSHVAGSELTKEPFRWDQRLFSLVLRLTGTPPIEREVMGLVASDNSPIDVMCEVTGGRSYAITTHRMLMQCIDSLVQKVQSGVVINFEKIGPDPPLISADNLTKPEGGNKPNEIFINGENNRVLDKENSQNMINELNATLQGGVDRVLNQNGTVNSRPHTPIPGASSSNGPAAWHSCRKMIYIPRLAQKGGFAVGFWPIPEAYWPDVNSLTLPQRTAHPIVKFTCTNQEPMVIDNLPFDKYELEPSPLTQFILSRKQPNVCWQVFVSNSHRSNEVSHSFGYLKASTNLQCVNLFVMPYNYPTLLPLLDDLFKTHRLKPPGEWRTQFNQYLRNMPAYYAAPLRKALRQMGAPNLAQSLIPDNMDASYLSSTVLAHLKRLKNQAKAEHERICNEVGKTRPIIPDGIRVIQRSVLRRELTSNHILKEKFHYLREQLNDFNGFMIGIRDCEPKRQSYRNPFDIPRKSLLDQLTRMRSNYLHPSIMHTKLIDDDQLHSMPVGQMGNYQEYLKRLSPPLREIESAPPRQHMFGNPFKIDKRMMADEVDLDLPSSGGGSNTMRGVKRAAAVQDSPPASPRPTKRKRGPLPKEFVFSRPDTPPPSPSPSPIPTEGEEIGRLPPTPPSLSEVLSGGFPTLPVISVIRDEDKNGISEHEEVNVPTFSEVNDQVPIVNRLSTSSDMTNHVDALGTNPPKLVNNMSVDSSASVNDWTGVNHVNVINNRTTNDAKLHNRKLRMSLYKEIRKPGRNFDELFRQLNTVQGSLEMRVRFVEDTIKETCRFKRKSLVEKLEAFLQLLLTSEHKNNVMISSTNR